MTGVDPDPVFQIGQRELLLLTKAADGMRRSGASAAHFISAVLRLPWIIPKQTGIGRLPNATAPHASDDLIFADLVRVTEP